jgi:uncharacterized protein with ParB-like and HNH nuclease domain
MGYFRIPRFQRPYSWERAEVEDFWTDTVVDSDSDYFIGSIVLFQLGSGVFGIVDGQQRLTTITMVLCALRDMFHYEGLTKLANGVHRLIERPDIEDKQHYVVQTDTSYPYLQEHIQKFGPPEPAPAAAEEEERLKGAFEYLTGKLRETIKAIRSNPSISEEQKSEQVERELIRIRDKILGLKVIVITLMSEEDAYMIFETLNTRGKDLTVSDLIRTHVTRLVPKKTCALTVPRSDSMP